MEAESIFFVHLIASTNQPVRMQYAQLIEQQLPNIGISAELDLVGWIGFSSIVLEKIVGSYDEGGYDICFYGISPSIVNPGSSLMTEFHEASLPPNGFNIMYWADNPQYMSYRAAESNAAIEAINLELDQTKAKQMCDDWQKLWYDVMPNVVIYNSYDTHAVSDGLYGYDAHRNPLTNIEDFWTTTDYTGTDDTMVVLGVPVGTDEFISLISTDIYDEYTNRPILDSLVGLTPSSAVVLPEGYDKPLWMINNHGTPDHLKLYPRMASSMGTWDVSGTNYTIQIRDDIFWHDGHRYDAWDAAMSYQASIIPEMSAPLYSRNTFIFGEDNAEGFQGNYSFQAKDLDLDGFYETLNIILANVYGPFESSVLAMGNYPEHILGDPVTHGFIGWDEEKYQNQGWNFSGTTFDPAAKWNVAPKDWVNHSFNTANSNDPGGYEGPLGTGSMVLYKNDLVNDRVELRKFQGIKWDNATQSWDTTAMGAGSEHYLVTEGKLANMPLVVEAIVTSQTAGISDMKMGSVNIMGPQFMMGDILPELQVDPTIQAYITPNSAWQGIGFNPQFTTPTQLGVNDRPLNRKGVRHAISHIIPRDDIINYLLNGLGRPAYTPISLLSRGVITEVDMISYKRSVKASDGLIPEAQATTGHDEYSIAKAMEWMATEGYDMTPWGGPSPGIDTIPPKVVIASPFSSTYKTGAITVDFSGDAWYYWYSISGVDSTNQTWTSPVQRNLMNGTYTLHAYGNDSAGNEAYTSVSFTIEIPAKTDTTDSTSGFSTSNPPTKTSKSSTNTTTSKAPTITPGWDVLFLFFSLISILRIKRYKTRK
jgi:ABC-type transport system substrate-binding protein